MGHPRVSIIILNWNGWEDTIECLESLYKITYPNYDVIVVDNGSKDDSIQKIKEYCKGIIKVDSKFFRYNPKNKPIKIFEISEDEARQGKFNRPLYEKYDVDRRLILIKNKDNYGFAGGNNIGIKFALSVLNPDYILLLNNDTVVDERFLNELVKVAVQYENNNVACFSPIIYYYSQPDIPQYYGKEYFSPILSSVYRDVFVIKREKLRSYLTKFDDIIETELFTGAAVLFKRDIIMNVGLLDENIFMGWDDIKYSISLKNRGYKCLYVKRAKIFHKCSVKFKRLSPFRIYQDTKNKIYTIRSSYSGLSYFSAMLINFLVWIPFDIFRIVVKSKTLKEILHLGFQILNGIKDGILVEIKPKKMG